MLVLFHLAMQLQAVQPSYKRLQLDLAIVALEVAFIYKGLQWLASLFQSFLYSEILYQFLAFLLSKCP
jgi:hypothetical protein